MLIMVSLSKMRSTEDAIRLAHYYITVSMVALGAWSRNAPRRRSSSVMDRGLTINTTKLETIVEAALAVNFAITSPPSGSQLEIDLADI